MRYSKLFGVQVVLLAVACGGNGVPQGDDSFVAPPAGTAGEPASSAGGPAAGTVGSAGEPDTAGVGGSGSVGGTGGSVQAGSGGTGGTARGGASSTGGTGGSAQAGVGGTPVAGAAGVSSTAGVGGTGSVAGAAGVGGLASAGSGGSSPAGTGGVAGTEPTAGTAGTGGVEPFDACDTPSSLAFDCSAGCASAKYGATDCEGACGWDLGKDQHYAGCTSSVLGDGCRVGTNAGPDLSVVYDDSTRKACGQVQFSVEPGACVRFTSSSGQFKHGNDAGACLVLVHPTSTDATPWWVAAKGEFDTGSSSFWPEGWWRSERGYITDGGACSLACP